jgi:uncharacterized protein
VKVLEVDIPRKRISLTLRLDDEAKPKQDRGPRGQQGQGQGPGQGQGQQGQRQGGQDRRAPQPRRENGRSGGAPAPAANSAMADALRRAGLTR